MKPDSRICAYINLDALDQNMKQMHDNLQRGTKFIAVVKADGYGHGAVPIAEMLQEKAPVWGFAVATVEEALELREHGIIKPILLLGYVFPEAYNEIAAYDLRPTVFTVDMARELAAASQRIDKPITIHLAVDTGMSRIGFPDSPESLPAVKEIAAMPELKVEGLFTHFARADEASVEPARRQLVRYEQFYELMKQEGITVPYRHVSNSAGIMQFREANLDLVRAGISMYGLYPSDEVSTKDVKLRPVMSLKSHISYLKTLPPQTAVSYGGTYVTQGEMKTATIPVGYADGYARSLSNRGYVLIRGKKAPIRGRICMDQFMVDVTKIDGVCQGDEVTLLGTDGDEKITMEQLGSLSGRFNYEFACCIGKRVPRVYTRS